MVLAIFQAIYGLSKLVPLVKKTIEEFYSYYELRKISEGEKLVVVGVEEIKRAKTKEEIEAALRKIVRGSF